MPRPRIEDLDPKQQEGIVALLTEPSVTRAAGTVGVDASTLYRWLQDPLFSAAYRRARREAFEAAVGLIHKLGVLAAQTLAKVMTDQSTPASAKVAAAATVLKFARESIELDDHEVRITALEESGSGPKLAGPA